MQVGQGWLRLALPHPGEAEGVGWLGERFDSAPSHSCKCSNDREEHEPVTTVNRRYVEMEYVLPREEATLLVGLSRQKFDLDKAAVFNTDSGIIVALPARSGPFATVAGDAVHEAKEVLGSLLHDVTIPSPWRMTILDHDGMEQHMLSVRDLEPTGPVCDEDEGLAGVGAK